NYWAHFEIEREAARTYHYLGNFENARIHAKKACQIAIDQGWVTRLTVLENEFPQYFVKSERVQKEGPDATRLNSTLTDYLNGLLRVSLASASTLNTADQAKAALDELIKVLEADRAFLFRAE